MDEGIHPLECKQAVRCIGDGAHHCKKQVEGELETVVANYDDFIDQVTEGEIDTETAKSLLKAGVEAPARHVDVLSCVMKDTVVDCKDEVFDGRKHQRFPCC